MSVRDLYDNEAALLPSGYELASNLTLLNEELPPEIEKRRGGGGGGSL